MAKKSAKTAAPKRNGLSYRAAGVDIDAGNSLVERIKPLARATARPGADAGLGGFGALFDLKAAGFKDPVLVSATDGVGTKLKLAFATGKHDTIGIDLVAMCVNDLVVQGAEPLFFLDYFATGKLKVAEAAAVVRGIAAGCLAAGAALVGGETAEMPGMYQPGHYDLAGFAVGAVERQDVLPRADVVAGDVILGIGSSGPHSNGYSLIRRVVDASGLALKDKAPFDRRRSLGTALLEPTRIYVRPALSAIRTGGVKALAHITGGGLTENVPRVLPKGLAAHFDLSAWPLPPVFQWLRDEGNIDDAEMLRTFNCGLGMVVVTDEDHVEDVASCFADAGEAVGVVGRIIKGRATRYSGKLESF